jgi:cytidylate kinase
MALIVAIDGPAGVGKSTTSKLVATQLGLPHIDTGAMYRAIALKAVRNGVALDDEPRLSELAASADISFVPGEAGRVLLDGEDVSAAIRTPEVSMGASNVSAVPTVRRILVASQQALGRSRGGVLEGRDIGTKVFPETPFKFFLTARPEVRAQRRFQELTAKGESVAFDRVLEEIVTRDRQDSTRADSPLTYDDSYELVDTSDLTIPQVVERIVRSVQNRSA